MLTNSSTVQTGPVKENAPKTRHLWLSTVGAVAPSAVSKCNKDESEGFIDENSEIDPR